jgi:hypothetical protein
MTRDQEIELSAFRSGLAGVKWLSAAGAPFPGGVVVADVATAWDDWNAKTLATWSPRTYELERIARQAIGDAVIDEAFACIATSFNDEIRNALQAYFDRRPNVNKNTAANVDLGLWPELCEAIIRDVAWAAIEHLLGTSKFFTELLAYYRAGRWPCSWEGDYPDGVIVVL